MIKVFVRKAYWDYYESADEATAAGIEYVYWKQADANTTWVLTDTGYVVPVISVYESRFKGKHVTYPIVRIPTGTFRGAPSAKMTHEKRDDLNNFTGKSTRYDDPARPLTTIERKFVKMLLLTWSPEMAYQMTSSRANPHKKGFGVMARQIARRANVERAVSEELGDRLAKKGMSSDWVLDQLKDLITSTDSGHVKLAALNRVAEMHADLALKRKDPISPFGREVFAGYDTEEQQRLIEENRERARLSAGSVQAKDGEGLRAGEGDARGHGPVCPVDVPPASTT